MNKNIKTILLFSIIIFIIDQIIKNVITSKMILNQSIIIIKNFFNVTLVYNKGAAFSLFLGGRIFFIIVGIAAIFGILFYIKKLVVVKQSDVLIYALLLGGILGNLIDRIIHGYVIDYFSFNIGSLYFPIFNFADACIVLSIILLFVGMLKEDLWS